MFYKLAFLFALFTLEGFVSVTDHTINEAISLGFFTGHIVISFGVFVDLGNIFA